MAGIIKIFIAKGKIGQSSGKNIEIAIKMRTITANELIYFVEKMLNGMFEDGDFYRNAMTRWSVVARL